MDFKVRFNGGEVMNYRMIEIILRRKFIEFLMLTFMCGLIENHKSQNLAPAMMYTKYSNN